MVSSLPDFTACSFYHCTPSQYKSIIARWPTPSSMIRNMIPHVKSVPLQCCHFPRTSKLVNVTLGTAKSMFLKIKPIFCFYRIESKNKQKQSGSHNRKIHWSLSSIKRSLLFPSAVLCCHPGTMQTIDSWPIVCACVRVRVCVWGGGAVLWLQKEMSLFSLHRPHLYSHIIYWPSKHKTFETMNM